MDLLPYRVLYGSAGVELGAEMATGNVWPNPPQPCGIIIGTQSLSLANPTSWITNAFRMIPGMPLRTLCNNHSSHVQADMPQNLKCCGFGQCRAQDERPRTL